MTISLFLVAVTPRFHELQQPCKQAGIECEAKLQLTPMEISQLESQNLNPQEYALILTSMNLVDALFFWVVGFLIFWRRSNDPGALVISFALVVLGASGSIMNALARQDASMGIFVQILDLHPVALIS